MNERGADEQQGGEFGTTTHLWVTLSDYPKRKGEAWPLWTSEVLRGNQYFVSCVQPKLQVLWRQGIIPTTR